MRIVRWLLLGLYCALISGFALYSWWSAVAGLIVLTVVTVAAQVVFLYGTGWKNPCLAIRPRRLWLPVVLAVALLAILVGGLCSALIELARLDRWEMPEAYFWGFIVLNWAV